MRVGSALLWALGLILIGTLTALLAILTALLLLLAALVLVAVGLRVLLVLLVGVVSHFPYSCCHTMPSCRGLSETPSLTRMLPRFAGTWRGWDGRRVVGQLVDG